MSYADKTLTCRDCGTQFVFTAGEQEFYAQKGFTNEPTRCTSCRQARKQGGGGRSSGGQRATLGALLLYPGTGAPERYASGVGSIPLLPGRTTALGQQLLDWLQLPE